MASPGHLAGLLALACAAACAPPKTPPASPSPRPQASASTPWSSTRTLRITTTIAGKHDDLLTFDLQLDGPPAELRRFTIARSSDDEPAPPLSATDGAGPLECTVSPIEAQWQVECPEPRTPPLTLHYERPRLLVSWPGYGDDGKEMVLRGEPLYLLPSAWDAEPIEVSWRFEGRANAATSFALGTTQDFTVRGTELRHGDVMASETLAWARLHDGRLAYDSGAAIGEPMFDPRWVFAELAGVRTAVDGYFGGHDETDFMVLIGTRFHLDYEAPFAMRLRARSLWIDAHMMASWSAQARIRAAELLVGRWLGGRIRLVDDRGPAAWFHLGLARHVARRMLLELGLLDRFEYAEDVNAIEAVLATLPPPDPDAGHSDPASLRRALALGSTYAAHLEADLRTRDGHPFGLRDLLRQFLLDNATTRDVPVSAWHDAVGDTDLQRLLTDAGPKRPPKRLHGPCFVPRPTRYRELDLGLGEVGFGEALQDVGAPAREAGLAPGDRIVEVVTEPQAERMQAQVRFERDGVEHTATIEAVSVQGQGWTWAQVDTVPDADCVQ